MKTATAIATIAAFFAGVHGLATPVRRNNSTGPVVSPVEGFGVQEITWEVETTPGGPVVSLNGTYQEVHAQLLQINPKYDEEFAPIVAKRNAAALAARTAEESLHKRDWTVCNAPAGTASADTIAILEGISYLRGLSGQASNGPGPRNCGRVSCSWNSAIWYCNNSNFSKSMPWFHVANAAQVLVDQCTWTAFGYLFTRGERWHDDGWFAIVGESSC